MGRGSEARAIHGPDCQTEGAASASASFPKNKEGSYSSLISSMPQAASAARNFGGGPAACGFLFFERSYPTA